MIIISKKQTKMPMQDPKKRVLNFEEVASGYTPEQAIREAMRCLRCRKHPCMTVGCPVHNHIPEFIAKITEGDFEGAYQILTQTTSLPAVCGRVCPQYLQCEGNCVRGKNGGQPVAIGALERFVADWHRQHLEGIPKAAEQEAPKAADQGNPKAADQAAPTACKSKAADADKLLATSDKAGVLPGKSVAVIGSGPASLACAGDLLDLGFQVTLFEREQVLGGVLAYGIPSFRLPKEIVKNEIGSLKAKGIKIETGKALGQDFSLDDLLEKRGFAAVFIGNGAGKPMRLGIPGQETEGVVSAADFLAKANLEGILPPATKIAVVGGGNVAMDACRAAVRIPSAQKVYIVYRRSLAEMPADPSELQEALDEGVEVLYLTGPLSVESSDGHATGLKCQKMALSDPDESGRRKPVPVPGSEFVLDADLIIEAIGSGSSNEVLDGVGLSEGKGLVLADLETGASTRAGVYAGGDTVTGPKTVISAMGAGRKAAKAIAEYLNA